MHCMNTLKQVPVIGYSRGMQQAAQIKQNAFQHRGRPTSSLAGLAIRAAPWKCPLMVIVNMKVTSSACSGTCECSGGGTTTPSAKP